MKYLMNIWPTGLSLDLPDNWNVTVIRNKPMPVLSDPVAAMSRALKEPVGSKTLTEEAKGRSSVASLCAKLLGLFRTG